MTFVKVAEISEIPVGAAKAADVGGKNIAIFNVEGTFYAVDSICPHKGGPLAEGLVQQLTVTCPWHGANFSLETGKGLAGPCGNGIRHYATRVSGNDLEVDVGAG